QNIPGAIYNTESLFEWQNNGVNGSPSPNPPLFFIQIPITAQGNPLQSIGYGGVDTRIAMAGVGDSGTRLAVKFDGIPPGASVHVPSVVYLGAAGGVLVRTVTDANGAGPFTAGGSDLTPGSNLAVYEVLWSNPFFGSAETEIPYTILNAPAG